MAANVGSCQMCGHQLDLLRRPLKRLRWSGHWWKGVASLFGRPLRACNQCGAIYSEEGDLLAVGAIQTNVEQTLDVYRRDMAYIRDSFGGVILAAALAATWLLASSGATNVTAGIIAVAVGAAAFVPFGFFVGKARLARKQLRRMKETRLKGQIPSRG